MPHDPAPRNKPVITLDAAHPPVRMSRRDLLLGLAAGSVVAFTGCAYNPELGRDQLMLVSDGQLAALAARAWNDLKKKEPVTNDPKYVNRLRNVGRRIVAAAQMQHQNWEYAAFKSDQKNAFVLPGGKVGFYTGMIDFVDNDAQLAAVMGHEVGHVRARHAAERYSQQLAGQMGLTAARVALEAGDVAYSAPLVAALGIGLQFGVLLPYSRRHELEADTLGVTYMAGAGYNPRQAIALWRKMATQGGPRPPEFLSTHPDPTTRIAALERHIAQMGY